MWSGQRKHTQHTLTHTDSQHIAQREPGPDQCPEEKQMFSLMGVYAADHPVTRLPLSAPLLPNAPTAPPVSVQAIHFSAE